MPLLPIGDDDDGVISKQPKIREKEEEANKMTGETDPCLKEAMKPEEATTSSGRECGSPYKSSVTKRKDEKDGELGAPTSNQSRMKFQSPKEDCSPEDCCCCFYFIYLLFNLDVKPPAYEANPAVNGIRMLAKAGSGSKGKDAVDSGRSPGYSYFKNISTGSSIDSKSSWFDRYCNRDQVRDPSDDDNESDGWMILHPNNDAKKDPENQTAQSTPSTDHNDHVVEPIIDLMTNNEAIPNPDADRSAHVPEPTIIDYNDDFGSYD